MPPTHPSQADVAAAYRTLIAHETEPKEQDFYRTRLQRLEQATESVCEFDCRSRVAAAGVGVYCPQCSAKSADTDLTTQLAIQQIEGEAAWWRSIDFDRNASRTFDSMTGDSQQAVRTGVERVLSYLQSTGRLLADDEMPLTAEQVEDVRTMLWSPGVTALDAFRRLRALFPATEPAEEPCTGNLWCEAPLHAEGCYATHRIPPGRLAPAEPAEQETKAERCPSEIEGWGCSLTSGHDGDHTAHDQDGPAYVWPASSPVVPAPTETGPWQTWQEVPEGVWYMSRDRVMHNRYVNHSGVRRSNAGLPGLADYAGRIGGFNEAYAPFVAAEEGRA